MHFIIQWSLVDEWQHQTLHGETCTPPNNLPYCRHADTQTRRHADHPLAGESRQREKMSPHAQLDRSDGWCTHGCSNGRCQPFRRERSNCLVGAAPAKRQKAKGKRQKAKGKGEKGDSMSRGRRWSVGSDFRPARTGLALHTTPTPTPFPFPFPFDLYIFNICYTIPLVTPDCIVLSCHDILHSVVGSLVPHYCIRWWSSTH